MHKHGKIYDADNYAMTWGEGGGQIAKPDLFYILLNFVFTIFILKLDLNPPLFR